MAHIKRKRRAGVVLVFRVSATGLSRDGQVHWHWLYCGFLTFFSFYYLAAGQQRLLYDGSGAQRRTRRHGNTGHEPASVSGLLLTHHKPATIRHTPSRSLVVPPTTPRREHCPLFIPFHLLLPSSIRMVDEWNRLLENMILFQSSWQAMSISTLCTIFILAFWLLIRFLSFMLKFFSDYIIVTMCRCGWSMDMMNIDSRLQDIIAAVYH